MRYALISDIHSNFEALQAVLGRLLQERINTLPRVGATVGYGPNPLFPIFMVYTLSPQAVIEGNPDFVVSR